MTEIIQSLEQIEKTVKTADFAKIEATVQTTRKFLSGTKNSKLQQLDSELAVWQTKLNVILREPAGREGMAKHVRHWVEELRKSNAG